MVELSCHRICSKFRSKRRKKLQSFSFHFRVSIPCRFTTVSSAQTSSSQGKKTPFWRLCLDEIFRRNSSRSTRPRGPRVHPEGFRVRLPAPEWFSRPNSHRFFESRSVCRSVCCCLALLLASFSPGRCRPGLQRPGRLGGQTLSHTHARSRSLTHRGRKRQQTSFSAFSFSMSRPLGGESRQWDRLTLWNRGTDGLRRRTGPSRRCTTSDPCLKIWPFLLYSSFFWIACCSPIVCVQQSSAF